MDNFYRPAGDDPGDHQRTEQFWHGQGVPPGGQDPGSGYPWQQPGPRAQATKDHHRAWHWTVGIALAALLAGGGAIAGASLARTSPSTTPSADTGAAGSTGSGPGGSGTGTAASTAGSGSQAALLNATLNAAASPNAAVATAAAGAVASAPSAGTGAAAAAPAVRRCAKAARAARAARLSGHPRLSRAARAATARCRFIRRRVHRFFLLRGVDGQFSFRTRSGAIRTLAFERGVIESVNNGSSIVVKAADGTIWSWDLVSNTVVRDLSGKISKSALAVGQPVWVGGRVVSGAKDARLVFVRPPSR